MSCLLWFCTTARADSRELEARALFDQGLEYSQLEQWADAAQLFERSRELSERPATLLNLVLVYEHLSDPFGVLRSAQRLLQITDPERHHEQRERVLAAEARAYGKVARVTLRVVPPEAAVKVDGGAPAWLADGLLLLMPGDHELELEAPGHVPTRRRLQAKPGTWITVDLSLQPLPPPSSADAAHASEGAQATVELSSRARRVEGDQAAATRPLRTRRARAFAALAYVGGGLWLASVITEGYAWRRAVELDERTPSRAGYLSASDRYERSRISVYPLTWVGGALAATGLLGHAQTRTGAAASRGAIASTAVVGALSLVAGVLLSSAKARRIGESELEWPLREAGSVALAASLPALSWSLREMLR